MSENINIFYYSKFSKLCLDLLRMLESYNILNRFMLKCVDDPSFRPPDGLTHVPTLIVVGINKPLVANEAVAWFNNNKPYLIQQNAELQNKRLIYNMTKNMYDAQAPKGFSSNELSGTSDEFAYTDIDEAQPKVFCKYGDDTDCIVTPPKEKAMSNQVQSKIMGDVAAVRKQQEKEYSTMMKQEQIEILINKERNELMKNHLGI